MTQNNKFLVIGANGLIGSAVTSELQGQYPWEGTCFKNAVKGCHVLDITDKAQVRAVIAKIKPRYLIHCANLAGGAKFAQEQKDVAKKFYYDATAFLGEACKEHHIRFVFLSSECVFDGKKEVYKEEDSFNPVNVYGQYKADSETWIQKNLKDFIIIRTMSVFGWQKETKTPNAVMSTYFAVANKKIIEIPTFRWGTPTYVKDLAKAIVELTVSSQNGVYHAVGASYLNRYEWLKKVCDSVGWDSKYLVPQDHPRPSDVPYPHKIMLNSRKFSSKFKTKLHSLEESLKLLKQDINA